MTVKEALVNSVVLKQLWGVTATGGGERLQQMLEPVKGTFVLRHEGEFGADTADCIKFEARLVSDAFPPFRCGQRVQVELPLDFSSMRMQSLESSFNSMYFTEARFGVQLQLTPGTVWGW